MHGEILKKYICVCNKGKKFRMGEKKRWNVLGEIEKESKEKHEKMKRITKKERKRKSD
jgi:hypothetical protein